MNIWNTHKIFEYFHFCQNEGGVKRSGLSKIHQRNWCNAENANKDPWPPLPLANVGYNLNIVKDAKEEAQVINVFHFGTKTFGRNDSKKSCRVPLQLFLSTIQFTKMNYEEINTDVFVNLEIF